MKPGKGFTTKPGASTLKRTAFDSQRRAEPTPNRTPKLPPVAQLDAAERAAKLAPVVALMASEKAIKLPPRVRSRRPEPNADEKRHMGRVAAMGCILCAHVYQIPGTPAIVHHLRTDQGKMRASHYDTMGLCPPHHQFSGYGVHDIGREQFAARYGISEVGLLHLVQAALGIPLYVSPYTGK